MSQPYYFRRYQVENGLSYNSVFCSLQDRQGFMWFGTRDGLNRFDGYRFKVFRQTRSDSNSIGNNFIFSLHQNSDSVLWVGTAQGLYRYYPASEKFARFMPIPARGIRDINSDASGNLWVINGNRLLRYQQRDGHLTEYPLAVVPDLTSICVARNQQVWAPSNNGFIYHYNAQQDSFERFDVFDHSPPATSRRIEKVMETDDGHLLVATTNQGVKLFDTKSRTYEDLLTYNADKTEIYARDFLKGDGNEYWIATESGIYIYNLTSHTYTHLTKNFTDSYSISDNAVYSLCKDREGGIWAGTYFGGVNYYAKQSIVFEKYAPEGTPHSLVGNVVREITGDHDGNLWIGTEDGGLNKLNTTSGQFTHFQPTGQPGSIVYNNIHGLLVNGDRLWIGTYEHGLDVLDIRTGKVVRHYKAGNGPMDLKSNFIVSFCKSRNGTIYVATRQGLYQYYPANDGFDKVKAIPPNAFVYSVVEAKDGTLWAGTLGEGVFYFNPFTGANGNIRSTGDNGMVSNSINSVYEDSRGLLWFATEDAGLMLYNPRQQTFRYFTTDNGLPSNFVFKVIEDDQHHIWISTTKGLVLYQPQQEAFHVFTRANGLLSDQFNYNSAYKDREGRLCFGSVKGMVRFPPSVTRQTVYHPAVFITNLQLSTDSGTNVPVLPSVITHQWTLPHDNNSFSIDFAALSFASPEMTVYQYQLEGLDKGWNLLPVNRRVYFTRLSPGHYTFRVKASIDGVHWSEQEATLRLYIRPPFWATGWAYALYALLAIGLVFFIVRSYHRRTAEKTKRALELLEHEKEKEHYQSKIDFFTNVAHEIRTPLTLIRAPMERLLEKNDHPTDVSAHLRLMDRNTKRLLELTTQLLDFRKVEANTYTLRFTPTDVRQLITDSFQSFSFLAGQSGMQIDLAMPSQPVVAQVDVDAFQKIVNNLFDNAIKYGADKVAVQLTADTETLTLQVMNDGLLIDPALQEKIFEPFFRTKEAANSAGSGIGLALARSLAILHKGQLKAVVDEAAGMNVFVLSLPLQQASVLETSITVPQ
jgi:ligand-binding sensor domain-containing protein/signal transduction histidine kinase